MTTFTRAFVCLLLAPALALAAGEPTTQAASQPTPDALLNMPIPELRLDGIAFNDVIDFLRDITSANIVIDSAALKAAGGSLKTPISLNLEKVTLKQALGQVLQQVGKGQQRLAAGVVGTRIVITTTDKLPALHKQQQADAAKGGKDDPAKLNRKLPELNFQAVKLGDVVDFLRDITGQNIFVQWRGLERAGITQKSLVTVKMRDVPLHEGLRAVLDSLGPIAKEPLDFKVDKDKIIHIGPAADIR
jgi:hypothetical protein